MKIRDRMLLSGLLVFVAVSASAFATYRSLHRLILTTEEAGRRAETARLGQEIRGAIYSVVSAQRGFLLTGREELLAPYRSGVQEVDDLLDEAAERAESFHQRDRLKQVSALLERWRSEVAEPEIEARRQSGRKGSASETVVLHDEEAGRLLTEMEQLLTASAALEDRLAAQKAESVRRSAEASVTFSVAGALAVVVVTVLVSWRTASVVVRQVGGEPAEIEELTRRVAEKDPNVRAAFAPGRDTGIKASFYRMIQALEQAEEENLRRLWVEERLNEIWDAVQGVHERKELARIALSKLAEVLEAGWGALYSARDATPAGAALLASYAIPAPPAGAPSAIARGLVFEAATGGKSIELTDVPATYVPIQSGTGGRPPRHVAIVPLVHDRRPVAVLELALFHDISVKQRLLLNHLAPRLAVLLEGARNGAG